MQGVYELFEKEPSTEWGNGERINRLVFIGEFVSATEIVIQNNMTMCLPFLIAGYSLDRDVLLDSFKRTCL